MAVTKDLLLLAAGRRGLLSLPFNFGPEPKACVFSNNLGGWVWDFTVLDNVILGTGGWRMQKVVYWQACRLGK
eukprot:scaffold337261_cov24-Attheya_sp.AAC.1